MCLILVLDWLIPLFCSHLILKMNAFSQSIPIIKENYILIFNVKIIMFLKENFISNLWEKLDLIFINFVYCTELKI